ncbi:class I SAM-dependent methyltransferase [Mycobacterium sp. 134]|uniref:class I SAM-dependent methyltransferase n=1 Tax=Mycobacterium sp. 134 TaxID=3400425 RepID=UPI003AAB43C1
MGKIEPDLGTVQETLLIPLFGRANDATSRHPILDDRRAVELVNAIEYDFTRFKGMSLPGSVLRTAIFDGWVQRFLDAHPAGTVVELGTGLNTRFDRLDNGELHWFDIDLPDSIALRQRFFSNQDRYTMLAGSILGTDWFDEVAASPPPYLFISEAVLVYLTEEQVRTVITQLTDRFAGSQITFDTGGAMMMRNQDRNGVMRSVAARMQWVCEDPHELQDWGMRLIETRTFAQPQPEVGKKWPMRYRYGMPLAARLVPAVVNGYKLNLFRLGHGR